MAFQKKNKETLESLLSEKVFLIKLKQKKMLQAKEGSEAYDMDKETEGDKMLEGSEG